MSIVERQPIAIHPGGGSRLKNLGVTHLLTSAQTDGAYYLCEAVFDPEGGSPLHIHHNETEVIQVLDGAMEIRLDNRKLSIPQGGVVHLPKKVPHALQNALKIPLKILVFAIPGGLEHYFEDVDAAIGTGRFDAEIHAQISTKYGLEWLE